MKSAKLRKAVFAGSWYPANAADCEREITAFLDEGKKIHIPARKRVGGIVPHAGWVFSGSIACNVIRCLKSDAPPDVVVVFGMHLHPDSACMMMAEGAWETPFGEIYVEEQLAVSSLSLNTFLVM
jgi:AmmeMemoRadiSam system protein B